MPDSRAHAPNCSNPLSLIRMAPNEGRNSTCSFGERMFGPWSDAPSNSSQTWLHPKLQGPHTVCGHPNLFLQLSLLLPIKDPIQALESGSRLLDMEFWDPEYQEYGLGAGSMSP